MGILVPLLLLLQEPVPLERLVEELRSDRVEQRSRAELELKLRGDAAVPGGQGPAQGSQLA